LSAVTLEPEDIFRGFGPIVRSVALDNVENRRLLEQIRRTQKKMVTARTVWISTVNVLFGSLALMAPAASTLTYLTGNLTAALGGVAGIQVALTAGAAAMYEKAAAMDLKYAQQHSALWRQLAYNITREVAQRTLVFHDLDEIQLGQVGADLAQCDAFVGDLFETLENVGRRTSKIAVDRTGGRIAQWISVPAAAAAAQFYLSRRAKHQDNGPTALERDFHDTRVERLRQRFAKDVSERTDRLSILRIAMAGHDRDAKDAHLRDFMRWLDAKVARAEWRDTQEQKLTTDLTRLASVMAITGGLTGASATSLLYATQISVQENAGRILESSLRNDLDALYERGRTFERSFAAIEALRTSTSGTKWPDTSDPRVLLFHGVAVRPELPGVQTYPSDLEIPPGKLVAVLGPSGVGKSTLFKTLAQLVPIEGELFFHGMNMKEVDRRLFRHHFAGVPVEGVPPLRRQLERWDITPKDAIERLERHGFLSEHAEKIVNGSITLEKLSTGERARVGLLPLWSRAKVVALDEPFANLEESLCQYIAGEARRRVDEDGISVLVSDQKGRIVEHCDWVVLLDTGNRVVFSGPRELLTPSPSFKKSAIHLGLPSVTWPLIKPINKSWATVWDGLTEQSRTALAVEHDLPFLQRELLPPADADPVRVLLAAVGPGSLAPPDYQQRDGDRYIVDGAFIRTLTERGFEPSDLLIDRLTADGVYRSHIPGFAARYIRPYCHGQPGRQKRGTADCGENSRPATRFWIAFHRRHLTRMSRNIPLRLR
jgi:ABC-type branched-subunit amino acid transport system ATPase component